jgi:hypothetical protein
VGSRIVDQHHVQEKHNECGISELSPIITSYSFQAIGMFIVQPQSHALKVFKHFILALQEVNSRVTQIIIHDDKNIPEKPSGL